VNEATTKCQNKDANRYNEDDVGVDDEKARYRRIDNFFTVFRLFLDVQLDKSVNVLIAGKDERVVETSDKLGLSTTCLSSSTILIDVRFVSFVAVLYCFRRLDRTVTKFSKDVIMKSWNVRRIWIGHLPRCHGTI